jgi:hypothetical protein
MKYAVGVQEADPRAELGLDINDLLAGRHQLLGQHLFSLNVDGTTAMQPVPREHAAVLDRIRRRGPLHELDHVSQGG